MTQVPTWVVWTLFWLCVFDAAVKLVCLSTLKYPRATQETVGGQAFGLVLTVLSGAGWYYFIHASAP